MEKSEEIIKVEELKESDNQGINVVYEEKIEALNKSMEKLEAQNNMVVKSLNKINSRKVVKEEKITPEVASVPQVTKEDLEKIQKDIRNDVTASLSTAMAMKSALLNDRGTNENISIEDSRNTIINRIKMIFNDHRDIAAYANQNIPEGALDKLSDDDLLKQYTGIKAAVREKSVPRYFSKETDGQDIDAPITENERKKNDIYRKLVAEKEYDRVHARTQFGKLHDDFKDYKHIDCKLVAASMADDFFVYPKARIEHM